MTMRACVVRRFEITPPPQNGKPSTVDVEQWSLEVDGPYNPDVADDLARRVVAMRDADRAAERRLDQENPNQ